MGRVDQAADPVLAGRLQAARQVDRLSAATGREAPRGAGCAAHGAPPRRGGGAAPYERGVRPRQPIAGRARPPAIPLARATTSHGAPEWTGRPARPLPRLVPHASTLCRGGAGWREWAVGGAGGPLYMGQRVPSRCTRGLLTRICVSSLSTPLHALPSYRSLCRSPRCAGASAAGRTSAPSCSAWRTGASRRELPRALPLPRLHLGHTSVVSRLQELLRTLAALEKTEGDLNDDSLMKEMLFSSS